MTGASTTVGLAGRYRRWRASTLGAITDRLERQALLDPIGDVSGREVLDVGCGDGALARVLAGCGARVVGIDADAAMIVAAKKRGGGAAFAVARAEALPFADRSFDIVAAVAVLCLARDPAAVVAEMVRVLRPGGRLVLGELGRWSSWAAWRRLRGWLGDPVWRRARFHAETDLLALLRASGLNIRRTRGAIYYPPVAMLATAMAPLDRVLSRMTTIGAAFLTIAATRPDPADIRHSPTTCGSVRHPFAMGQDGSPRRISPCFYAINHFCLQYWRLCGLEILGNGDVASRYCVVIA